jgi:hypothetical protein
MEEQENQIVHVNTTPMVVAEIESQIATAKEYPRNISKFKDKLMSMANLDQSTAEGCFYALPRAGKSISGPSIRFAEIALSCYGNAVAQADVTGEDDKYVYATGMCRDLENNVAVRITTRRRITNRDGIKFKDDMIATTANAACAIALRNAIFKIVPAAFTKEAFDKVKLTAVGDAESFSNRRANVLDRLQKLGVDEKRVLNALRRASVDELTLNDVTVLIGLGTAVHDGETTLDEAFPEPVEEQKAGAKGLETRLTQKTEKGKDSAETPAPALASAAEKAKLAKLQKEVDNKAKSSEPPAKRKRGRPKKTEKPKVRTCRVCGCTDEKACNTEFGPCEWVGDEDLCTACEAKESAEAPPAEPPKEVLWFCNSCEKICEKPNNADSETPLCPHCLSKDIDRKV